MKHLFTTITIAAFLFSSINISFAQKNKGNVFEKGTYEYKMFMAKQDFFSGDYRSAVNKYKEVLKNRPGDASLQFYIGQCYYMMREYNAALEFLENAKNMNVSAHEELSLVMGKTYHAKGMLAQALDELNTYRKSIAESPQKLNETEVDVSIAQCNLAKQLMAKPVNVKVIPLIDINSQYDDKGPVLTNSDKTLIFTSRRTTGDKSKTDTEGDYGYFDNIYESYWSDEKKTWQQADLIQDPVNSDGYNACNSISNDGMTMFFYRNDPSEARGGALFMSKKTASGKWKTPEILLKPINTTYYEDAACISPDGNTLYFVSERPGGLGRGDIYESKKIKEVWVEPGNIDAPVISAKTGEWAEPVNIGAPVNSSFDENGLYLTPDGKTLFFCSNGTNSMGSYDIFRTTLGLDGKWTVPVNLGYPVNSVGLESKFVMTADKKTAYISSLRDSGLGERDIFMIDVSNYDVMTGESAIPPKPASLTGKVMSSDSVHTALSVEIRILDKATGAETAMTKSGADGSYTIEFAGDKQFILEIILEGYGKFYEEISVPAGKTESKNITLNKNN